MRPALREKERAENTPDAHRTKGSDTAGAEPRAQTGKPGGRRQDGRECVRVSGHLLLRRRGHDRAGDGAKAGGASRGKREGPPGERKASPPAGLPGAGERTGAAKLEACLECRPLSLNCAQQ